MDMFRSMEEEIKRLRTQNARLTQDKNQLTKERDESISQTTPLTFPNLLALCHEEIAEVRVERDRSSCTTGKLGDPPPSRLVPTALRSWSQFPTLQESTFSRVKDIYDQCQDHPKTFPNLNNIITFLKPKLKPLASELDLRKQQADCVEDMVKVIVEDLIENRRLPDDFELGSGIQIDNHPNSLPKNPKVRSSVAKWVDQIFIRKVEGNTNTKRLVLVIEYKPPHKLSVEALNDGLKDLDPLEIIHRVTTSNEKTAKFVEDSEMTVTGVLAQVYTYMIDSGIQYAYLTTGEAFVFLNMRDSDRKTLYYHMILPGDAFANGDRTRSSNTAIGQVLSFYVLACRGKIYDQDTVQRHRKEAVAWIKDDKKMLANMSPSPQKPPTPSSHFKPHAKRHAATHSQDTSNRKLRSSTAGETPSLNVQARKDDMDSDSDDSAAPSRPFGPVSAQAGRPSQGSSSRSTNQASQTQPETPSSSRKRHESYCSHRCLLGLATEGAPDPSCPNYHFHPRVKMCRGKERHAINVVQLRELLLIQLQETMNTNIEPLGIQGSRGAIFKLTLASHGYTMIGKGTPPQYVPDLRDEKAVYHHLRGLQGTVIPVCLGAIDSPRHYIYHDGPADIYHWLLVSFAGESLKWEEFQACESTRNALRAELMRYGINHPDISPNNFLWDEQAKRLMIIDFERVRLPTKKGKEEQIKKEKPNLLKDISRNMLLRKRKVAEDSEDVAARPAKVRLR